MEICRFANFELDRRAYQLRRDGNAVALERIPLEVLFLLTDRQGQLVTRDEIFERIWGKGLFLDVDNAINTAVRKIRRALDENPEAPRFILTVPAKGYRFIAEVYEARTEPAPGHAQQSAFVGRAEEIGLLRSALDEARAGHGQLALISGSAGVGKTRLVMEAAKSAHARGMQTLIGRCDDHDESVPYLPFVEILESCVDQVKHPELARRLVGEEAAELARMMPKLRRIVPNLPEPLALSGEQARRHLFNSYCDFIARIARENPAVLIVDDLHWADDSTLALLRHLAKRLPALPVLIVAVYRDGEVYRSELLERTLEQLLRARTAISVALRGFGREDVGQMLSNLVGQAPPVPIVDEFQRETEGNPFFVEELFRYLKEEHRLFDSTGSFLPTLAVGDLEVPQSVRLILGRRLARLSNETFKLLSTAAAIGHSFAFKVLEAAARSNGRILENIDEAQKAGMIQTSGESPVRLEFSHELIRQTVLSSLSAAHRQQLHLEVAVAVERVYADALEEHLAELAHYHRLGGDVAKAVEYLWKSGVQAAQRSAYKEGIASLTKAIELLADQTDNDNRARTELRLQRGLATLWWAIRDATSPEARSAMLRALELGERVGDRHDLFIAVDFVRSSYSSSMQIREAREYAERELALAERADDPTMMAIAHVAAMGDALLHEGEFLNSLSHIEKGLAITSSDALLPPTLAFWPAWSRGPALSLWALNLWLLGKPDIASGKVNLALKAAREDKVPFWRASGMYYAARTLMCMRDRRTLEVATSLAAYVQENHLSFLAPVAPMFVAWALSAQGKRSEGIDEFKRARRESHPHDVQLPTWLSAMLADADLRMGRCVEGLQVINAALGIVQRTHERMAEAELHRLKGELLLVSDGMNEAKAEESFRAALDVARAQNARSWELRAAMSFARLQRTRGKPAMARAVLAPVYDRFTEGFDTADLIEAQMLLDELAA